MNDRKILGTYFVLLIAGISAAWAVAAEPPFNPYAYSFASRADSLRAAAYWYELATTPEKHPMAPFGGNAADALLRVAELDPGNVKVVRELIPALIHSRRHAEALVWIEKARQQAPEDVALWEQKAVCHRDLLQHAEAVAAYFHILRLEPARLDRYHPTIDYFRNLGFFAEAVELYREASRRMPDSVWVWGDLGGILFFQMHEQGEGLALIEKAIALDPQNGGYRTNRATALGDLGRTDEAVAEWDRALALAAQDADRHSWLLICKSQTLQQAGRYAEAEATLDQAVNEAPRNSVAWQFLGEARRAQGKSPEAQIEAYDQALGQNNLDWQAWAGKAEALRDQGKDTEALAAFDKALQQNPLIGDLWLRKGWLLRKMKRYGEALECTGQAVQQSAEGGYPLRPESVLNLRCDALLGLGRYEAAIAAADSCLKLRSNFDNPRRVKGMALYHLGRPAEAEPLLERAHQLDQRDFENWRDLAIVQQALGKSDAARRSLARALELNPGFRDALANEPELQELRAIQNSKDR